MIPTMVEVFVLSEAMVDMRRMVRAALAILDGASEDSSAAGDREMSTRSERASERIGKTMDLDRVQDTHLATLLLVAQRLEKKVKERGWKLGFPEQDLQMLVLYARHRLGLNVRGSGE